MFGFLGFGVKAFNRSSRGAARFLLGLGKSGGRTIVGGHKLIITELWQGPKELTPARAKTCLKCRNG
jgi:hypothetical protein